MFFLWLSQPICYGLFITYGDKAKGYRIFTLTGTFIMSVFLFLLVPKLFGDAAYYVLNRTINFEWRDEAKCGDLKVKNKNEKYFGFNTDKYTVFYSDKNDKWGFYELTCQKGSNRKDFYAVEYLPEYNIPAWLK
ncbi:membrane domain protein [Klebsiella michiganensis]|nr:membrane domain protein [Klebsiella michiganensis]